MVFLSRKMSLGLKWLITAMLGYAFFLAVRYAHLLFSDIYYNRAAMKKCCEERQVDISDSRLSNFGSDSGPNIDTSEVLTVDRIIPLTSVLNRVMNKICRKFSLYVQLEDRKIMYLKKHHFNLTFFVNNNSEQIEKNIFGMNAVVSRLDSLQRLGNAFIAENSDSLIVLIQKFRFQILKYKYDYYDEDMKLLGSSSFILPKNALILNITLSTNYDNSECRVISVNVTFVHDIRTCLLKLNGILGTTEFYAKLKSALYDDFTTRVTADVKSEIMPLFAKIVHQADLCSYFNVEGNPKASIDSRDFLSAYVYDK